ncbi:MAG: helix-turn-helix transcriptional regulator, partial [Rhizobiales bacterium]|nr:helix-turn-helix transcriptional regulator [Rhizobacter sp.]
MSSVTFAQRLDLVLKALSMSRARLAADLGIDKSLAGRWVSGAVQPSAYNLERLTVLVAVRCPGFTMLDWDRDLDGLADRLGVVANGAPAAKPAAPRSTPPRPPSGSRRGRPRAGRAQRRPASRRASARAS